MIASRVRTIFLATDATFTPVFAVLLLSQTSPVGPYAPFKGFSGLPPLGRISTRTHRRTAAAACTAQPAVNFGF